MTKGEVRQAARDIALIAVVRYKAATPGEARKRMAEIVDERPRLNDLLWSDEAMARAFDSAFKAEARKLIREAR